MIDEKLIIAGATFVGGFIFKHFWDLFFIKEELKRELATLKKFKLDVDRAHTRIRAIAEQGKFQLPPFGTDE